MGHKKRWDRSKKRGEVEIEGGGQMKRWDRGRGSDGIKP